MTFCFNRNRKHIISNTFNIYSHDCFILFNILWNETNLYLLFSFLWNNISLRGYFKFTLRYFAIILNLQEETESYLRCILQYYFLSVVKIIAYFSKIKFIFNFISIKWIYKLESRSNHMAKECHL